MLANIRPILLVILTGVLASGCGGGGGDTPSTNQNDLALPSLVSLQVPPTVHIPRGNSTAFELVITRANGFDGMVELNFDGLPYGVWVGGYWDSFLDSGVTTTTVSLVAQSDTPDGIFKGKVVATATGSADRVVEFDIIPGMMERDPVTDAECWAHWLPLIKPITTAEGPKDGWTAISRLKDGGYAPIPDTRYKEWMLGVEVDEIPGRGPSLRSVRERIYHFSTTGGVDWGFDRKTSQEYLMDAEILGGLNGCYLRSGYDTDFFKGTGPDSRTWYLISHRAAGQLTEQLVVNTVGTEQLYISPIYELTFERTLMPTFVP